MSNPPYVREDDVALAALPREPRQALVGGPDGLAAIRAIARDVPDLLTRGGLLLVEHGAAQAAEVAGILRGHGYEGIHCTRDYAGLPRVTAARTTGPPGMKDTGNRIDMITISTNRGDIKVSLFDDRAPISCENFRRYVSDGSSTARSFTGVIPNFMVQGAGSTPICARSEPGSRSKNEAKNGESNCCGTLAMARTSAVDSATAEVLHQPAGNASLDHGTRDYGYAVFGEVRTAWTLSMRLRR